MYKNYRRFDVVLNGKTEGKQERDREREREIL